MAAAAGVTLTFVAMTAPPRILVLDAVRVVELSSGDSLSLNLQEGTKAFAFVTPRCVPCFRYFREIVDVVEFLPGEEAIVAPSVEEARFFAQFVPDMRVYAALDTVRIRSLMGVEGPLIVYAKDGRLRAAWRELPSRLSLHRARWLPL